MNTNDIPFDDDFDLSKPVVTGTAPRKPDTFREPAGTAPEWFKENTQRIFEEPCQKCRGTGRFHSWSGRAVGECFACKGTGKKVFKTSREDRSKAKAQRIVRQVKRDFENIEGFKAEHPELWAWMENSTFEFAVSLREKVAKYGSLSEGQITAARNCLARYEAKKAENEAKKAEEQALQNKPVDFDVSKIVAAIEKAETSMKEPVLRGLGVKIRRGKAHWRNPDAIYIFAAGEEGGTAGMIVDGKFRRGRAMNDEIEKTLQCMAVDPHEAAIQYGKETGVCGCCGRTLTDPVSIEKGIGPICESKWF